MKVKLTLGLGALSFVGGAMLQAAPIADQYARAKYEAELKKSGFELSIPIAADDPIASAPVRYEDVIGDKTARLRGEFPHYGEIANASTGDTIFSSFLYDVRVGAVTMGDLDLQDSEDSYVVPAGTRLKVFMWFDPKRPAYFCEDDGTSHSRKGKQGSTCFTDRDFNYQFDEVFGTGLGGKDRQLPLSVAYRLQPRTIKAVRFRSELIFLGAAGGILRVGYREYINELARPAFSTELTYDIAKSGPTTFRYKTVQVTVFEASNNGIQYRVDPT